MLPHPLTNFEIQNHYQNKSKFNLNFIQEIIYLN